jgi:HAD superfamily hydrolase (TIGR01509 family)
MDAAIFFMDGLLIDSEPLWRRAEKSVFQTVGIDLDDDQCDQTTGMRIDEVVEYWYQFHPWQGASRAALAEDILSSVTALIHAHGEILPGVRNILDSLRSQGLRLALASSSPRSLIDAVLEKLDISAYFEVIHSATDEPHGKPHPAVYLSTAESLGLRPHRCLAFEDSLAGVRSAKAAGMTVIAVPAKHEFDDEAFGLADLKVASLVDLKLDIRSDLE